MLHLVTLPGGTGAEGADAWATRSAARRGTAYKQEGKGYATEQVPRRGSSAWRRSSNPRIIVAVMVDEPSAGKYFGGDVAAPVFSAGGAADAAHDGRAARPRRQAADRRRTTSGRGGELLMALHALDIRRRTRRAGCALRVRRRARTRQPPGARRATASSPGRAHATDGRSYVARGARARRRACLVERDGVEAFGFDDDAHRRATRGLKAAAGPIAAASSASRASSCDVVAVTGTNGKTSTAWWIAQALTRARPPLRRRRHARHRRAAAAAPSRATLHRPA